MCSQRWPGATVTFSAVVCSNNRQQGTTRLRVSLPPSLSPTDPLFLSQTYPRYQALSSTHIPKYKQKADLLMGDHIHAVIDNAFCQYHLKAFISIYSMQSFISQYKIRDTFSFPHEPHPSPLTLSFPSFSSPVLHPVCTNVQPAG